MMNAETRTTAQKKLGVWSRLTLRGRLLTIMLSVALTAVLICAGSFAITLTHMLKSSRQDARSFSDTVHHVVEMAFYQQETHIRQTYTLLQARLLDQQLERLVAQQLQPNWNTLLVQAYDLINNAYGHQNPGVLESEDTIAFLLAEGEFYVHGADRQFFLDTVDIFYSRLHELGEYPAESLIDDLRAPERGAAYTTGQHGMLLAWYPFAEGQYRVGLLVPNTSALHMSEGLKELIVTETGRTITNMTLTARQSALGILLALVLIVGALTLTSRRLASIVVNPVEQEQRHQRDLLRVAREENAMLERLDKLKTEFLANVSHELKTPLTVMSGYAQYSQKTLAHLPEMAEVEDRMKLIASEADRLALMVSQILDITRIEEGRMTVTPRPASLVAVIQKTINTYYPVFTKNNNTLISPRSEELANVLCDEARISQVLVNLISNANKHTRDGKITITAKAEGAFAVVRVSDTGVGISRERLPHLFERYANYTQRADVTRTNSTGLGLYICKHIVEAHGGNISVSSQLGEGTTVTFTLPFET